MPTSATEDRGGPGFGALLAAVRERRSRRARAIGRLTGTARLATAAAWARISHRPVVLLTAEDAQLLSAATDLESLLPAVGAPHRVLRLPGFGVNPYAGVAPHPESLALRAVALHALAAPSAGSPPVVVASASGALIRTAPPARLRDAAVAIRTGPSRAPARLGERLARAGYRYEDPVGAPGDFARRGGIVDLFPVDRDRPVRLEFGYDDIEAAREFDPATQRSIRAVAPDQTILVPPAWEWVGAELGPGPHAAFSAPGTGGFDASLPDYLGAAEVLVAEPDAFREAAEAETRRLREARTTARRNRARGAAAPKALALDPEELQRRLEEPPPRGAVGLLELESRGEGSDLPARPAGTFRNRIPEFLGSLTRPGDPERVVHVFVPGEGAAGRFRTRAAEAGVRVIRPDERPPGRPAAGEIPPAVLVHPGPLSTGFEMPGLGIEVISGTGLVAAPPRPPRQRAARSFLSDFRDLKPGDLVVHTDHGVGRFVGMKRIGDGDDAPEFVEIRYRRGGTLLLPVERLDLLEKYSASGSSGAPALDRLGSTRWARRRKRVAKALRDIASDLIRLYARRRRVEGYAFPASTPGMDEFVDGFGWTETDDQARAIREVFADMEAQAPMDRLLAGDVGFGKTEVALRAAFKAAMDGKQVAVLAPTTVLSAQLQRVFESRFEPFPVEVELLSRFRTPKQQKQIVAGLRAGTVDIVIGTHRLLSKDVGFRDLGLLVVDEEQRFGVSAKEKLKRMAVHVDHLAMTATPIPRTLNMSLSGIRDMSVIETPPRDRLPVQTHVLPFDPDRIAEAVRYELAREGQVYFVHNRVRSLPAMARLLSRIVPEARILTAHGQMREKALEQALLRFQDREADILLSTTIIENGIDLPRVNTLIVNRADAFGLAQLYQIRGRVGRSPRRAYAYLMVPEGAALSESARPRLAALREFSELGAGFRVAALDMELRGAGNLLGAAQHGHLEAVGFDLYYRLLEEAVAEARGEKPSPRCAMQLRFQLRIPRAWLEDERQRMWLYKRCSAASDPEALGRFEAEVRDRFGPPPATVTLLFEHERQRLRAEALGYTAIRREGGTLRFASDGQDGRGFRALARPGAGPAEVLRSVAGALDVVEAAGRLRQEQQEATA